MVSIYHGPTLLAFDLRYNRHLGDLRVGENQTYGLDPWKDPARKLALPRIPTDNLILERVTWDGWMPPHLLFEVNLPGNKKIFLCDYASAGQTGTPYHSWLPVERLPVD